MISFLVFSVLFPFRFRIVSPFLPGSEASFASSLCYFFLFVVANPFLLFCFVADNKNPCPFKKGRVKDL